ncbi:MAG TPA: hypothetical protein PKO21_04795 [Verrucomicrobiota bacterium]|nr:hypothetical protein [Verrucomicrobiota bacterium]
MTDPRHIAASIVGAVDWQSEVSGFCRCPGESLHTHKTGKKDCRINVDGAPTIYCFHASCAPAVAEANRRLRRGLNASPWALTLPGGKVLRSGDVLQASGTVLPREVVQARAKSEGRDAGEQLILETLTVTAERFKPELFENFHWPFAQILEDSPLLVAERDAEDQFRTWLKLWPAHCHVWIGDIYSSGRPEHRTHFRPIADWYQIGPVMGNFTCGSSFKPGSFQRSNANCNGTRFMVVESDTLAKDEVGAIFAYLNRRLHFNLHAIIDTAGKSLHGWLDAPRDRRIEARLKAVLTVFGCDPKLFTYSQPVRVPGAYRDGKLQRIVWLKD